MSRRKGRHCGVPQCNSYDADGVSMHLIPKHVRNSKAETLKWKIQLKMGKDFPKQFLICSKHFKSSDLLEPREREGVMRRIKLVPGAFPVENLPASSVILKKIMPRITKNSRNIRRELPSSASMYVNNSIYN